MNDRDIIKALNRYCSKGGVSRESVWGDWLEWLCHNLDFELVQASEGYAWRYIEMKNENPYYFEAMIAWMEYANANLKIKDGAFDAFGEAYEANFQSSYKASKTGQFFTPMSVCLAMAQMQSQTLTEPSEKVIVCEDCACGSGRTLIACWGIAEKSNRILFKAGDIDITSVKMCALNFFICGMVGCVERKDALTGECYEAYIVNAGKVPYWTPAPTLQHFDNEHSFKEAWSRLRTQAEEWNIIKYR